MDFRQLQYMLKIVREQSFSKAAEKLYISQPSLSQHISKLEQQLGVQLFDRTSIPLQLTYAGELFAKTAKHILDLKSQLDTQIQDINNFKIGRLIIAISYSRGTYMLPQLLPLFHKKFPGIEINLIEGTSPELEDFISEGIADIAFLAQPTPSKDIQYEVIQEEEMLIALHPDHPLARKLGVNSQCPYPHISMSSLQEEHFILLKHGQSMRGMADRIFQNAGFKPRVFLETKSYETALALVKAGMGAAFSVATMLQPGIAYFSIGEPAMTKSLSVAYSNKRYLSKAAREFINITKEVWGSDSIRAGK